MSPAAGVYASTYRGAASVVSVSLGTLDPHCTPLARDRSPAGSFRSVEHIATRPAIVGSSSVQLTLDFCCFEKSIARGRASSNSIVPGKKNFCLGELVASDPGSRKGKGTVGGASGRRWGSGGAAGLGGGRSLRWGAALHAPAPGAADSGDRACEWQSRGMRGAGAAGSSWGSVSDARPPRPLARTPSRRDTLRSGEFFRSQKIWLGGYGLRCGICEAILSIVESRAVAGWYKMFKP